MKKKTGISNLKSRYGLMFISPWIIGLMLFFLFPIGQSIFYSFCNIKLDESGIHTFLVGMKNYNYIVNEHPFYLSTLTKSIAKIGISLPSIFVISLLLAIILNQQFKGRIFFRGLYFLPVIIATGVVVKLLFEVNPGDVSNTGIDSNISANMIDFEELIEKLEFPQQVSKYILSVLNELFSLVWNSGIQIILFISGLQSIPDLLYEVAKVEGCTKWEEFWFVTFPLLSRISVLVIVFTVVDLLTSQSNDLMDLLLKTMGNLEYGVGSAMSWLYFLSVGVCLSVILYLVNRFWVSRWR